MLTVGNHIIEAPFAWSCRAREIELAFSDILTTLASDPTVRVVRAPVRPKPDTIYDNVLVPEAEVTAANGSRHPSWAVNNTRPSFDAADFMRFGKTLLGQLSHVTNEAGVAWLRQSIPDGYSVEILEVDDPHAMHIDATLLPLRQGLLVYNPERVNEAALRKHQILKDWRIVPYPFRPSPRDWPPRYMTSGWLLMNVLSLDSERVRILSYQVSHPATRRLLAVASILVLFVLSDYELMPIESRLLWKPPMSNSQILSRN